MGLFQEMMEGPTHNTHGPQIQVGWLGHSGMFYPWGKMPTKDQEPGGYLPVYIDSEH